MDHAFRLVRGGPLTILVHFFPLLLAIGPICRFDVGDQADLLTLRAAGTGTRTPPISRSAAFALSSSSRHSSGRPYPRAFESEAAAALVSI
jgi:hypothetical protein